MQYLNVDWSLWGDRLLWTLVTLGVAYVIGRIANLFVGRLVHLASKTEGQWDDIIIEELKRRIPIWSVLAGAWLALDHWQLTPAGLALGTKIALGLAGLSLTLMVASIATRLLQDYGDRADSTVQISGLTHSLARIVVIALGLMMIATSVGINITPVLTAMGLGGLAIALALEEPLSNLFAGLFISMAGQVKIGDFVKLEDGNEGRVIDLDWRSTRIRMLGNNIVIVPNLRLSQSIVTNYTRPEQNLSVVVQVGVDYASDLEHVERVTIEVASEIMRDVEGGIPEFEPYIRYHTFADSSINFSVLMRAAEFVNQYRLKHEFVKRLHARYAQEGIEIPFPIQTLDTRGPIPVVSVPPKV